MEVGQGRIHVGHLNGGDGHPPDVTLVIVGGLVILVTGNDLRGHPVRGPNEGVSALLRRRENGRDTKVR